MTAATRRTRRSALLGVGFGRARLAAPAAPAGGDKDKKDKDKAVTVTEKDDNGKVKLAKGDTLVVKLPAQSGTGFLWEVSKRHATQLKEVGKPSVERPEKPKPGGPVTMVFRF